VEDLDERGQIKKLILPPFQGYYNIKSCILTNPNPMKNLLSLLAGFLFASLTSFGQASSTNGNFTATTPSNLSLQAGATPTTRLTILNSNGNIGINTTAPADWLHVNGNVRANQFNAINGIFNTIGATTNLSLNTNGTNRMTVLAANGNVGIGTATPAAKLEVIGDLSLPNSSGAKQIFMWSATDNNWRIGMSQTTGFTKSMATDYTQFLTYQGGAGQGFAIGVNGGQSSFEVTGSNHNAFFRGNVGIGTATPAYKLDVAGTINATSILVNGAPLSGVSQWTTGGANINYATGNVGIGVPTPTEKLEVSGNIKATNNIAFGGNFGIQSHAGGLKMGAFAGGLGWDIQMVDNNGTVAYNKFSSAANVIGGITPTNASALFEIQSTTKGFLPPRMTSAQRTAIATPATGLMVYQTDGQAGTYQFNGTSWGQLAGGGGSSQWGLNGNAGTIAGTNFIGTTDNVDVVFKRNNVLSGRIGTNTTYGINAMHSQIQE
jgi:hypothetical protein